jgi:hypothetical protein
MHTESMSYQAALATHTRRQESVSVTTTAENYRPTSSAASPHIFSTNPDRGGRPDLRYRFPCAHVNATTTLSVLEQDETCSKAFLTFLFFCGRCQRKGSGARHGHGGGAG